MELLYNDKKSIQQLEELIDRYRKEKISINLQEYDGVLIHGDNFKMMAQMLDEYENKIDLIYIDPPFNTNSKFFYDKERSATVSFDKQSMLAYDDNMDIERYLEFIRERLYLMHKLLSDQGTLYVHIDLKVGHYVKILLDEIFGMDHYVNDITRIKSNPKNFSRKAFGNEKDVLYIYSKKLKNNIFHNIRIPLSEEEILQKFTKIDEYGNRYTTVPCHAPGETEQGLTGQRWRGMTPPKGRHWRSAPQELEKLDKEGKIEWSKTGNPRIKKYAKDHEGKKIQDIWKYKDPQYPTYPTEKNYDMLDMIVKQSSNKDSIIMDCFCGSGTFLEAGLLNGRKVIGIDQSLIANAVSMDRFRLFPIQTIDENALEEFLPQEDGHIPLTDSSNQQ